MDKPTRKTVVIGGKEYLHETYPLARGYIEDESSPDGLREMTREELAPLNELTRQAFLRLFGVEL